MSELPSNYNPPEDNSFLTGLKDQAISNRPIVVPERLLVLANTQSSNYKKGEREIDKLTSVSHLGLTIRKFEFIKIEPSESDTWLKLDHLQPTSQDGIVSIGGDGTHSFGLRAAIKYGSLAVLYPSGNANDISHAIHNKPTPSLIAILRQGREAQITPLNITVNDRTGKHLASHSAFAYCGFGNNAEIADYINSPQFRALTKYLQYDPYPLKRSRKLALELQATLAHSLTTKPITITNIIDNQEIRSTEVIDRIYANSGIMAEMIRYNRISILDTKTARIEVKHPQDKNHSPYQKIGKLALAVLRARSGLYTTISGSFNDEFTIGIDPSSNHLIMQVDGECKYYKNNTRFKLTRSQEAARVLITK